MAIPSIDALLDKLSEAFDKSAESHYKDGDRAAELGELFDDPAIRQQVDGLVIHGALLYATVSERVKHIFKSDEKPEPAPEPEPTPEPEAEPQDDSSALPEGKLDPEAFRDILTGMLRGLNPDADQSPRGNDRFPGF